MIIASRLGALQRLKRSLVACGLGVLLTLALPPFFVTPLIIPAFSGLFLLTLSAPSKRRAFADGWWFGLGFFTTGLYWICLSMFVEIGQFWWVVPFALFGLPVILAVYTGLAAWFFKVVSDGGRVTSEELPFTRHSPLATQAFLFASVWTFAEYARGHLFSGFPWNLAGYVWTVTDTTLQPASLVGAYGLSWLAVIVGTLPALAVLGEKYAWRYIGVGAAACALLWGWGAWRLETHPTDYTLLTLRIVQANIPQSLKWDPKQEDFNFSRHVLLSKRSGSADITLWPESAVPFPITPNGKVFSGLAGIAPKGGVLLTGGMRIEGDEQNWRIWNSLFAVDQEGMVSATYDKRKLVPFGEYIPLRAFLPLPKITHGTKDFSSGMQGNGINIEHIPPLAALVCYEAIFPELAVQSPDAPIKTPPPPQWLANVTNDAWFGTSTGPYQHLQMVRMRAVEQGLPLVRAANTGISALIDPYGRILQSLPLNHEGVLDGRLPKPAQRTLYAKNDGLLNFILIIIIMAVCLWGCRQQKLPSPNDQ